MELWSTRTHVKVQHRRTLERVKELRKCALRGRAPFVCGQYGWLSTSINPNFMAEPPDVARIVY